MADIIEVEVRPRSAPPEPRDRAPRARVSFFALFHFSLTAPNPTPAGEGWGRQGERPGEGAPRRGGRVRRARGHESARGGGEAEGGAQEGGDGEGGDGARARDPRSRRPPLFFPPPARASPPATSSARGAQFRDGTATRTTRPARSRARTGATDHLARARPAIARAPGAPTPRRARAAPPPDLPRRAKIPPARGNETAGSPFEFSPRSSKSATRRRFFSLFARHA